MNTTFRCADAGVRVPEREGEREQRQQEAADADATLFIDGGDRSRQHRQQREDHRRHRGADQERRQRDHPGEHAQDQAGDADVLWRGGPRRSGGDRAHAHAVASSGLAPASEEHADPAPRLEDSQSDQIGRDQQHDQALDHQREVRRQVRVEHARVQEAVGRPGLKCAEQQGSEHHADRGVASQQRHRDAQEADRRRLDVVGEQIELPAEDVHRRRHAGERAGDGHRREVVAGDVDPGVARGIRIQAGRADLEAEPGATEDHPEHDHARRAR